jgi:multidrug efflux pump subunit AcrB
MQMAPPAPVPLLLLSVVAAALAGCNRSAQRPPHEIVIEAHYPGANARMVADTVAAPIEQQVNGVEHMLAMRSRSDDDGRCTITVTFPPGGRARRGAKQSIASPFSGGDKFVTTKGLRPG